MIIDFHTHCFPDSIAQRAIEKLSYSSGGLEYHTDGTVQGLRDSMKRENVSASVVLNIATNAHQQNSVNNFAASINNSEDIYSFGSVYPDADDAMDELDRIKSLGLKGVKFHPEYQNFYVDDAKMRPLYKRISQLGLITVFHAGFDYGYKSPFHCMPENLRRALRWFDSPVVAAHWGGLNCGSDVIDRLCGIDGLYIDTSFGYGQMPRGVALEIIEKHGTGKLLFATDSPWHTASMELRLLSTLGLSDTDLNDICYNNANNLLNTNV